MSNSRENSPDWLRAFQAPTRAVLTLSSDSDASLSPLRDETAVVKRDSTIDESQLVERDEDQEEKVSTKLAPKSASKSINKKTPRKRQKVEGTPAKRKKMMDSSKKTGKEDTTKSEESSKEQNEIYEPKAVWTLSSDSESDAIFRSGTDQPCASESEEKELQNGEDVLDNKESVPKAALKGKSPKKNKKDADHTSTGEKKLKDEMEAVGDPVYLQEEEKTPEKHVESRGSSSMLPLTLPEKVQRSKALVECVGDSIDLSGDIGAVGRVIVSGNPPVDREMLLDLKGTIYRTTIVPSRTFCVVSVSASEAKIEAIMNDFIQLKPESNVYDAETMVEGTLEGYSDLEDEAEKMPKGDQHEGDQHEGDEEQTNEKTKAKSVKKSAGVLKKGKATGRKLVKKKPTAAKKGRARK